MTISTTRRCAAWALLTTTSVCSMSATPAETRTQSGFNLFSTEQDVEIGQRSAAEIERRQLPIVHQSAVDAYVGSIGRRLAADMPGATFPYQFKIVNAPEINAFALPGGVVYLSRGLIEAATNEGQLAGVLAHEMSHVALRHGSRQASEAYVGQAGLGILGGLLVRDDASTERVIQAVGGFGANALFLKFSRTDEERADIVGAQVLAKAGYDPQDMIAFFEALGSSASGKTYPRPQGVAPRIRTEVARLTVDPTAPEGDFREVKAALLAIPPAPAMGDLSLHAPPSPLSSPGAARRSSDLGIAPPSATFRAFEPRNGLFRIERPSNWQSYESADGLAVTLAPDGGFVDLGGDEKDLIYGVVLRHYAPFLSAAADTRITLASAHNDLVRQVIRNNPTFRRVLESERSDIIESRSVLSLVLWGRSEATGEDECVTVVTRKVSDDHVVFALFIAPGKDYGEIKDTFARMMGSLRFKELARFR